MERSRLEEEEVGGRGSGPERRGFPCCSEPAGTPSARAGRAFGGGRLGWELPASGLVEVVVRGGFRLGGIESRDLIKETPELS